MIFHGRPTISIAEVKEHISDIDIASRYLGITEIPTCINSMLRKDNNPSLALFESQDRKSVLFKDFGTNETGNIYKLLSLIWHISVDEVLEKIYNDTLECKYYGKKYHGTKVKRRGKRKIDVELREWRIYDKEYWHTYGITLKALEYFNVFPVKTIIIENEYYIPAEKHSYVYIERKDDKTTIKIYQPLSKTHKWFGTHNSSVWDLWRQLPEKGEKLIITSSRKDAMCLWVNTKIPSVSLQGEGYIPKETVVDELKGRFEKIYVLYDNDFEAEQNYGHIYGEILANRFDLTQIEIPSEYRSKDPSDLFKNHGKNVFKEVINNLL